MYCLRADGSRGGGGVGVGVGVSECWRFDGGEVGQHGLGVRVQREVGVTAKIRHGLREGEWRGHGGWGRARAPDTPLVYYHSTTS